MFVFFLFFQLWAFNGAPEWSANTPTDLRLEAGFSRIDSEYVSDQLAYSHPIEQEFTWRQNDKAMDFSFGSISSERFLYQARVKVISRFHSKWSFEYYVFEQEDYENRHSQSWVGVTYSPWSFLRVGVFGTPSSDKGIIDYKVDTTLLFNNYTLSLYSIMSDMMKNSKSIDGSEYEKKPKAYGLGLSLNNKNNFYLVNARIDPMSFLRLDSTQILKSEASLYQLVLQKNIFGQTFRVKSELSEFYEQSNSDWARQKLLEIRLEAEHKRLGYGVLVKNYKWTTDSGELNHYNQLPYVYYKIQNQEWAQQWVVEATRHKSNFSGVIEQSSNGCASCDEYRLNYEVSKAFSDQFSFRFKLTFDLDEFGSENSWEGGSGQFYLKF